MQIRNRTTDAIIYDGPIEGLENANLEYANLYSADLHSANLRYADLYSADLHSANLRYANLYSADLRYADLESADLRNANLYSANLRNANLTGVIVNWTSHDLIAEILRQHAGDVVSRRMVAGLVSISYDWCWDQFIALRSINEDDYRWAFDVLASYVKLDDDTPEILRRLARKEKG
jgi:hypothetical protein